MGQKNNINGDIDGLLLNSLNDIQVDKGNVLHALKSSDKGYHGFGEAYFSLVDYHAIKGWKRHQEMTLNLIVPFGDVRFVIYDDREDSISKNTFQEVLLSRKGYFKRLTVPPLLWVAFQGLNLNQNIVLNIANIEHNLDEVDQRSLRDLQYNWSMEK
jgi:dTDP-4-dehydrorhamnose 3,5-epimerase|tara:strand:+ start:432 stop:902 length:471 start_codon:yes stop_codon:yes gene_type:complete